MNHILDKAARDYIKNYIVELPEGWQNTFKLMYGRKNVKESVDEIKNKSILKVVEQMPQDKLDWAMMQVENSLKKLDKKLDKK